MGVTPDARERFGVLAERRLAGLLRKSERSDLSALLGKFAEARRLFLRTVESHLDLGVVAGAAEEKEDIPMARIALNCSCGWNFFIPGSTQGHEVNCPSCSQSVRIPGRKPGRDVARSAGEVAAEAQSRQRLIRNVVLACIVAVLGLVGLLIYSLIPSPAPPASEPVAEKPIRPPPQPPIINNTPASPREVVHDPTPQLIADLRRSFQANLRLANLASLAAEYMRMRNLPDEEKKLRDEAARSHDKLRHDVEELAKLKERQDLSNCIAPGDRISYLSGLDFARMKPDEGAMTVGRWFADLTGTLLNESLAVGRGDQLVPIAMEFPEQTKEIGEIIRAVQATNPGGVSAWVMLPPDLLKDLQDSFAALPPAYAACLGSEDRARFEKLLTSRRGASEDMEWLKSRILGEAVSTFHKDAALVRSKLLEVEAKLQDGLPTDQITRKDGTILEGQIVEETAEYVKVKKPLGSVKIPRSDIQKIEKNKGSIVEFPGRLEEALKADTPAEKLKKLSDLLGWCIEKKHKLHKEYVGLLMLTFDPSRANARSAAGLPLPACAPPR